MRVNPMVVDLSRYDDVYDWSKVWAAGIRGVINKATEGTSITDSTYAVRADPARRAGMLYGAYHFLRPGSMEAQALHFISTITPIGTYNLLLALDHEDERVSLQEAKQWLMLVYKQTGRRPILYSGHLIKDQLEDNIDPMLQETRLWLAQYSAHPTWPPTWDKPWLWQFTGDGQGPMPHTIDGIHRSGIDIDSFDGTFEQLKAEWADGPKAEPSVSHTMPQGTTPELNQEELAAGFIAAKAKIDEAVPRWARSYINDAMITTLVAAVVDAVDEVRDQKENANA